MPLPVPRLDDRDFATLMRDALEIARKRNPEWSDESPGDPGMTLLELFAFLTDNLLYRLNRVPEKLYVTLLNLMGVARRPPSAARVVLAFSRSGAAAGRGEGAQDVVIPAGLRVATDDGTVEFTLSEGGVLAAAMDQIELPALHCERIEGELAGVGTGAGGQSVRVRQGPVIAESGDGMDVVVAVECLDAEAAIAASTIVYAGTPYRVWSQVRHFGDQDALGFVYTLDRIDGRIGFALDHGGAGGPIEVPASGCQIRVWYRRGGGRAGNVVAGSLTTVKTPDFNLLVRNDTAAAGGADGETLEQVLRRGPEVLDATHCAVTARDYERLALSVAGIARARAQTQAQLWRHAAPGSVEVLLVPDVGTPDGQRVTTQLLATQRSALLLSRVEQLFEERRPLGVRTLASWADCREVSVSARIVAGREASLTELHARSQQSLHRLFSPYAKRGFGRAVRASDVYETLLGEPSVRYVDQLRFTLDEAPDREVRDLVRDPHQPRTWFAATADGLFGSRDDGESWACLHGADGDRASVIACHPRQPGLMAYASRRDGAHAIHLSRDCGRQWQGRVAAFDFEVFDLAWTSRNDREVLLIAAEKGLFEWQPAGDGGPALIAVAGGEADPGFYAVVAHSAPSGVVTIAAASRANGGVYLSTAGGVSGSYRSIGLKGKHIRRLGVQMINARSYLWAGVAAEALQQGEGALRCELRAGGEDDPEGFKPFTGGWQGGSCTCLAFAGTWVYAGSNRGGVLRLDTSAGSPAWQSGRLDAGLPIRDTERLLQPIHALGAESGRDQPSVITGTDNGLYRSLDGGDSYQRIGCRQSPERAALPPDWLYCSGSHVIQIVVDEEGD